MNKLVLKFLTPCVAFSLILVFESFVFAQNDKAEIKLKAQEYLKTHEPELEKTRDANKKFDLLFDLAPAALSAGETKKAEDYAQRLLKVAKATEAQDDFGPARVGYAVHTSNIVLGLIALEKGETDKSKEYLLAAGLVTGEPPTLISFGPDMSLAKKLVEKGERDAVIRYFGLCAKFWIDHDKTLVEWTNIVRKGGIPDFQANLVYVVESWAPAD